MLIVCASESSYTAVADLMGAIASPPKAGKKNKKEGKEEKRKRKERKKEK
jgi:hypothetical protein